MATPGRTNPSRTIERGQRDQQRGRGLRAPEIVEADAAGASLAIAPEEVTSAIVIERLILHHLDNRTGEMLLVEAELALDANIRVLFASYIAQAHENADWQARFLADQSAPSAPSAMPTMSTMPTMPTMPALCARLLDEPSAFVEVSQEMARRLFAQMRQRPNQINPGDFVVAIYTVPGVASSRIALFKLDPDARLVRDFSLERGRRVARISLADNLMPQTVRLKQKCALISPSDDGADFSVALLDTLANIRSEGVAVYFYRGFLATQILPSARRRTRLFLRATDDWLTNHASALAPTALLQFYQARRDALAGETLDLPDFALAVLLTDGALAADLLGWLTPRIFDAEYEPRQTRFTIDRATADPVVQFVTLELDGGARVRIPAERFAAMARVDNQRVGGKIRLTIETLTLKEGTGL